MTLLVRSRDLLSRLSEIHHKNFSARKELPVRPTLRSLRGEKAEDTASA